MADEQACGSRQDASAQRAGKGGRGNTNFAWCSFRRVDAGRCNGAHASLSAPYMLILPVPAANAAMAPVGQRPKKVNPDPGQAIDFGCRHPQIFEH
jgi:hypothetical protein